MKRKQGTSRASTSHHPIRWLAIAALIKPCSFSLNISRTHNSNTHKWEAFTYPRKRTRSLTCKETVVKCSGRWLASHHKAERLLHLVMGNQWRSTIDPDYSRTLHQQWRTEDYQVHLLTHFLKCRYLPSWRTLDARSPRSASNNKVV